MFPLDDDYVKGLRSGRRGRRAWRRYWRRVRASRCAYSYGFFVGMSPR